jgi:hypothetical protein
MGEVNHLHIEARSKQMKQMYAVTSGVQEKKNRFDGQ